MSKWCIDRELRCPSKTSCLRLRPKLYGCYISEKICMLPFGNILHLKLSHIIPFWISATKQNITLLGPTYLFVNNLLLIGIGYYPDPTIRSANLIPKTWKKFQKLSFCYPSILLILFANFCLFFQRIRFFCSTYFAWSTHAPPMLYLRS